MIKIKTQRLKFRNFLFRSKLLAFVVFFFRLKDVIKFNSINLSLSLKWLFTKSEFTNFNYDLLELNKRYLISFIAFITRKEFNEVEIIIKELENNQDFRKYIKHRAQSINRSREIPKNFYYGRRVAWYALIRILKPYLVVETGTDKGLGTLLIAQALKENGVGIVYTLDVDPYAGSLIEESKWNNIKVLRGDSLELLKEIKEIDLFIHDSDHSRNHEYLEYKTVEKNLSPYGVVLSDNSEYTDALLAWSLEKNREFISFKENPRDHWYKGDGIGFSRTFKD